jgi:hypothetical protein
VTVVSSFLVTLAFFPSPSRTYLASFLGSCPTERPSHAVASFIIPLVLHIGFRSLCSDLYFALSVIFLVSFYST